MLTFRRIYKALTKHASKGWISVRKAAGAPRIHQCPACSRKVVDFFRYGTSQKWGCPECGSSPRERLMNFAIARGFISIPRDGKILHIAPSEQSLVQKFSQSAGAYIPADLDPSRYRVKDVQQIDLMQLDATEEFSLVYASHVMEHVPDDGVVLRNIYRALKPGGQAWLIVPLHDAPTIEGSLGMPPRQREKLFGQWDHVRQYGMDFRERIEKAGFKISLISAKNSQTEDRAKHGLGDIIFVGSKP